MAEKFQRWNYHEVLLSIRKHGVYVAPGTTVPAPMSDDELISRALVVAASKLKALEAKSAAQAEVIEAQASKIEADASEDVHFPYLMQSNPIINCTTPNINV